MFHSAGKNIRATPNPGLFTNNPTASSCNSLNWRLRMPLGLSVILPSIADSVTSEAVGSAFPSVPPLGAGTSASIDSYG